MSPVCLIHVLSSNDAPDAAEVQALKEEKIALKSIARKLRLQLEEIEARLNKCEGALSAIRRVPNEIMGEIFAFSLETPSPLNKAGREELVNFGLVCQTWRDATLLTHRLWSSVAVFLHHLPGSYDQLSTWLGRAATVPKSLCVHSPSGTSTDNGPSIAILHELLTCGPALDHLSLEFATTSDLEQLVHSLYLQNSDVPSRPWDNLRSLAIIVGGDSIEDVWFFNTEGDSKSIFSYLPRVTSFSLRLPDDKDPSESTSGRLKLGVPPTFLEHLTSFEFTCDWEGPHILTMLQHCSKLEHLVVDMVNESLYLDEEETARQPFPWGIVFPKLQTLRLKRHQANICLLDHLITPALAALDIEMDGNEFTKSTWAGAELLPVDSIRELVETRSKCQDTLHSLRLHSFIANLNDLLDIIACMPSLTWLTLDNVRFSTPQNYSMFWGSVTMDESLPLVRNLEVLQIDPQVSKVTIKGVMAFLVERGRRVPPKCEVAVSFQEMAVAGREDILQAWARQRHDGYASMEEFGLNFRIVPREGQ
ncbi:hypothetical protein DFP72DRAFT_1176262 [Ephemerocybe angulata]|uniref:F-box domain-containing protein n=1 Tax=Ephemerocybe angulata TaxID=980116 RepID=A0A8H6HEB6_9AGAR|nr:hypothetical protein DFP72DRAFT_1176262 [Tulosesus angulatus]